MGDFHNIFKNLRMQNHYTQGQMADLLGFPEVLSVCMKQGTANPISRHLKRLRSFST